MEANKLMTLDGLIERLQEIRDYAGKDLPMRIRHHPNWRENNGVITTVTLETSQGADQAVSVIIEFPHYSHFEGKETINYY